MAFRILFFLLLVDLYSFAQPVDSTVVVADSTLGSSDDLSDDKPDSQAAPDSSKVVVRNFNQEKLEDLKSDISLQYKEPPTIAESILDRFMLWISQLLDSLFRNAVTTNWGRVFSYVIGVVIIVVLIMMILKVNAFKVFYSGQGASTLPYNVLDENIHEMDFDELIQQAIAQRDYRRGVRLLFLHSLKMLADKNFIHWEEGKTNHDYLNELTAADLKTGFNELNFYFEYAWYGNFSINHEMFLKVQHIFSDWREKIR